MNDLLIRHCPTTPTTTTARNPSLPHETNSGVTYNTDRHIDVSGASFNFKSLHPSSSVPYLPQKDTFRIAHDATPSTHTLSARTQHGKIGRYIPVRPSNMQTTSHRLLSSMFLKKNTSSPDQRQSNWRALRLKFGMSGSWIHWSSFFSKGKDGKKGK